MDDADAALAEQIFFEDPALDRMLGVIFRVATELQLLRATVQRMEALLERHGISPSPDVSHSPIDEKWLAALREDRIAYVENILSPLIGRSGSRGAP